MALSSIWWLLTGAAVVVELLTGTFYLLMLALGLAAAALAAHAGLGLSAQLVLAAGVGGGAVVAWHLRRSRQAPGPTPEASRDVHLDVGEPVWVGAWQVDGTASVRYRGSQWQVRLLPGRVARPGAHRVAEVVGNQLLLEPLPAPPSSPPVAG